MHKRCNKLQVVCWPLPTYQVNAQTRVEETMSLLTKRRPWLYLCEQALTAQLNSLRSRIVDRADQYRQPIITRHLFWPLPRFPLMDSVIYLSILLSNLFYCHNIFINPIDDHRPCWHVHHCYSHRQWKHSCPFSDWEVIDFWPHCMLLKSVVFKRNANCAQ